MIDTAEERMLAEFGAKRVNAVMKAEAYNICNGVGAYNPHGKVPSKELRIIGFYGTYHQCFAFIYTIKEKGSWKN